MNNFYEDREARSPAEREADLMARLPQQIAHAQQHSSAFAAILQGVDAASIRADGWGESEPVKACEDGQDREALIACLQPNRRVEIQENATSAK